MEDIRIRNIKKEDLPQIVDIQINSWKIAYRGIIDDEYLDNLDREEKIAKRENDYKDTGFIVAEINDEIVGFARYIGHSSENLEGLNSDCELMALYVKPELRHRGIGSKMFEHIRSEFEKKNKKKMIWWCLKGNEEGKRFYEKIGGKIICEKKFKIGDKDYDEICFLYNI